MKLIKNLRVRYKLLLIAVPLMMAIIVALICASNSVRKAETELTKVYYDTLYEVNNKLLSADRDYYQAFVGATGYYDINLTPAVLPPDLHELLNEQYMDDYTKNRQQVYDNSAAAMEIVKKIDSLYTGTVVDDKNFKTSYDELLANLAIWEASYDVKNLTGDWSAFNETFGTARDNLDKMQDITTAWALSEKARVTKEINTIINVVLVIFAVVIAVLLCFTILIIRSITKPLKEVSTQLGEIADGNLLVTLPDDSAIGRDELGDMQRSTKYLANKLSDIIGKSKAAAKEVDKQSEELSGSAIQANATSQQVTDAVGEISKGAVSQAESIEKAAGDTGTMGDNIDDIAGSVDAMDRCAADMKNSCDKAMSALNTLIRQSESVTASVKEIGDSITSTNNSSKEISQFTEAITDIASQTNLLSLNASIEAARAGEMGKGFAVVATEIGSLANESSEAVKSTHELITGTLQEIENGNRVVDATTEALNKVQESVNNIAQIVQESGDLAKSQAQNMDEISKGIEQIAVVVQNNTATAEESSAVSAELSTQSDELNDLVSQFVV